MRATLDGNPEPDLEALDAHACMNEMGGYSLYFKGLADPQPVTHDEIEYRLYIRIEYGPDGNPATTPGQHVEVKDNPLIHLSANAIQFMSPKQNPVSTVTGTITLSSLSYKETSGSALLLFTDPDDVNSVIRDWLILEVAFENLATLYECPKE
jgi:hypothetical protein